MQIIVPMSGKGSRFKQAGYRDVKPLIEVDDAPIIEHVIKMFPGEHDFLFICAKDALAETPLRATLQRLAPRGRIIEIQPHKLGPVHAVLQAEQYIKADRQVVVNYCDFSVEWDYQDFKRKMAETGCDGCITAYKGFHPHSLGPNLYAYMRHENNYLLEIAEKHCFTSNRMEEYASAGTYYFRTGQLLLKYFKKAVDLGLSTNGEFYASTPYNLLVEDELPVYIYELTRFLQWGTPEDLEEYKNWSHLLRECESWRPSKTRHVGVNLIPMAGAGARFAQEGYADPKPLVSVAGRAMIDRSLECLPSAQSWIAVCQGAHLQDSRLQPALANSGRNVNTIEIESLTDGQAATCLLARERIDPEAPLLIAPCDSATVYDEEQFMILTSDPSVDSLVFTFSNHPHANRNPRQYGWVLTGDGQVVMSVLCKQEPSGAIQQAKGIVGTFWFRKASFFFEAADRLIAENRRVNGEFYVDSCITLAIENGVRTLAFPVRHYVCFGTPADVRTYEYWYGYFSSKKKAAEIGE